MQYRDATIDDLPIIVDIYNSTIPGRLVTAETEMVTVADKMEWFNKHTQGIRPLWMAEEQGNVIGWVSFQDFYGRPAYKKTAEISIYLQESYRGKGYGKKILKHCINAANGLGLENLLGFIFSHNVPSISLFLLQGFEEWGELKNVALMDGITYSVKILGKNIHC